MSFLQNARAYLEGASILVSLLVIVSIYMLPSIIAIIRRNRITKVILFNFFLGWTIVLWILPLVWACKKNCVKTSAMKEGISPTDEIMKYKELLDAGAINEEEYAEKKKFFLNL